MTDNFIEPTAEQVAGCLTELAENPRIVAQERTVALVFSQWPRNECLEEVWAKAAVLNSLYSTNIYELQPVAEHIIKAGIDDRLRSGDLRVVEEIAVTTYSSGKTRNNLSFASKYCSWHQPELFQIYDQFVVDSLCAYQSLESFADFRRDDLRSYARFVEVFEAFREHYQLTMFTRKQLDQFLWSQGKRAATPNS